MNFGGWLSSLLGVLLFDVAFLLFVFGLLLGVDMV
jgi:hypothetical protein